MGQKSVASISGAPDGKASKESQYLEMAKKKILKNDSSKFIALDDFYLPKLDAIEERLLTNENYAKSKTSIFINNTPARYSEAKFSEQHVLENSSQ